MTWPVVQTKKSFLEAIVFEQKQEDLCKLGGNCKLKEW